MIALTALLLAACGDDSGSSDADGDADGDVDADADGDSDVGWTIETVDPDGAANDTSLAISASGQIGIAYYTIGSFEDGSQCPIGVRPDGSIVVAYTCQVRNGDGSFEHTLKLASRPGP